VVVLLLALSYLDVKTIKEIVMNPMETLFKAATQTLEDSVLVPVTMQKLAERGYAPEDEEELAFALDKVAGMREALAGGEVAPIPARELENDSTLSKHASEKASNDFLAFAEDVDVDYNEVDERIKTAAAVLTWQYMEATNK
jgi:hypothetical protein